MTLRPLTIILVDKGSAPKVYRLSCPQLYDVLYGYASLCKVCPKCLRVWAVLQHDGDPLAFPCSESCIDCNIQSRYRIPGSLLRDQSLADFDHGLLANLPRELLVREFLIHSKAVDECTPHLTSVQSATNTSAFTR